MYMERKIDRGILEGVGFLSKYTERNTNIHNKKNYNEKYEILFHNLPLKKVFLYVFE